MIDISSGFHQGSATPVNQAKVGIVSLNATRYFLSNLRSVVRLLAPKSAAKKTRGNDRLIAGYSLSWHPGHLSTET